MGGFFHHGRRVCPGGDRGVDLDRFSFASRAADGGANTAIAMNVVCPNTPSPKTAGCRRFIGKRNRRASSRQPPNRKCTTAARSPARAPPIWRWPLWCCRAPNGTPCPRSTPFAARWMTWRMKNPRRWKQRRARLAEWRADVRRACESQAPEFPVNRELQPVIRQYHLPFDAVRRIDQRLRDGSGHQAL